MEKPKRAPIRKKPDLNSRVGKYYMAVKQGKMKVEAQRLAGYADENHITRIEKSKTYQAIDQMYYKDELLKQITLRELAAEQIKNILQDQDRGAKNKAIEMALDKIEPEAKSLEDDDKVLVILKG